MSSLTSTHTLYLCYFGLREPLVQTQVLPYLRHLAAEGLAVSLLTFEPPGVWTADERRQARANLAAAGISWHVRTYHRRPSAPATLYDIMVGACVATRLARSAGVNVLHARSHMPLAMALLTRALTGCRVIFDVRGLMADEYADAGVWRAGAPVFRVVKWLERVGLKRADQLVVLTRRMRDWIVAQGYARADRIEVIPCCVDFARFSAAGARADEAATMPPARFELVYAGAVTGLYLLEEMGRFFLAVRARRADAFLRILTKSPADEAAAVLRRVGLSDADFFVGPVAPADVPRHLGRARLGLSFRKSTFAQIGASPTKVPEYLTAGLPVVSNAGIGDTDELLERERVGVVLRDFDAPALAAAAAAALALADDGAVRARCLEVARRHFDLSSVGAAGYRNVYERIAGRDGAGRALARDST